MGAFRLGALSSARVRRDAVKGEVRDIPSMRTSQPPLLEDVTWEV